MSGFTEEPRLDLDDEQLVDEPDTLAGGEFTEELQEATDDAESTDAAAEPSQDIESDEPTQVADPDLSSDAQDAQSEAG